MSTPRNRGSPATLHPTTLRLPRSAPPAHASAGTPHDLAGGRRGRRGGRAPDATAPDAARSPRARVRGPGSDVGWLHRHRPLWAGLAGVGGGGVRVRPGRGACRRRGSGRDLGRHRPRRAGRGARPTTGGGPGPPARGRALRRRPALRGGAAPTRSTRSAAPFPARPPTGSPGSRPGSRSGSTPTQVWSSLADDPPLVGARPHPGPGARDRCARRRRGRAARRRARPSRSGRGRGAGPGGRRPGRGAARALPAAGVRADRHRAAGRRPADRRPATL